LNGLLTRFGWRCVSFVCDLWPGSAFIRTVWGIIVGTLIFIRLPVGSLQSETFTLLYQLFNFLSALTLLMTLEMFENLSLIDFCSLILQLMVRLILPFQARTHELVMFFHLQTFFIALVTFALLAATSCSSRF